MLLADDVRQKLRDVCQEAGSENAWAKAHGVSQAYVNDVINGRRELGGRILRALGFEKVVCYVASSKLGT